MKYTIELVQVDKPNDDFQITQNFATNKVSIRYGYSEDANEPIQVEVPVKAVIVSHNNSHPIHPLVKITKGYATMTLINKLVSGELKEGDEIFPDFKGYVEKLHEMSEKRLPFDTRELIRLANQFNTPIPIEEEYQPF